MPSVRNFEMFNFAGFFLYNRFLPSARNVVFFSIILAGHTSVKNNLRFCEIVLVFSIVGNGGGGGRRRVLSFDPFKRNC